MGSSTIAIKIHSGIVFLNMEDILCCIACGRYTKILTVDGREFLLTRVLKEVETNLSCDDFYRTHKSFLINLNHIVHYQNNNEASITLLHNVKVQLAKRRKQEFQKVIKERVRTI